MPVLALVLLFVLPSAVVILGQLLLAMSPELAVGLSLLAVAAIVLAVTAWK